MNAVTPSLWAAWRPMLLAPWHQRRTEGGMWALWLTLLAIASLAMLIAVLKPQRIAVTLAVAGATVLLIAWSVLVSSLAQQNHPHVARLVPGHARRLRALFVATLALLAVAAGLAFGAAFGKPLAWALGAGALLLFIGWAAVWPVQTWTLFVLLSVAVPLATDLHLLSFAVWRSVALTQGPLVAVVLVVATVLSARWLFGEGHDAHGRRFDAQSRQRRLMQSHSAGAPVWYGNWLGTLLHWPYHHWLRRLLTRESAVGSRLAMVFGPTLHPSAMLFSFVLFGGLVAVGVVLLVPQPPPGALDEHRGSYLGPLFGLLMAVAGGIISWRATIHSTRREQALLLLAPGLPRGAALNRWLHRTQAIHLLSYLAVLVAIVLAMLGWLGRGRQPAVLFELLMALLPWTLAFGAAWLGSDWSRQRAPDGIGQTAVMLSMVLLTLMLGAMKIGLGVPAGVLAAAGSGVLAALLLGLVQRARRLPQMLPAGRRA